MKLLKLIHLILFHSNLIVIVILLILITIVILHLESMIKTMKNDFNKMTRITKSIVSNADTAFWIYHVHKEKYTYISTSLEGMFEITEELLRKENKKIIDYFPKDVRDIIIHKMSDEKESFYFKYAFEYIKPISKTKCWIMLRIYPIVKNNKIIQFVTIAVDITNEKRQQHTLEQAFSDLKEVNDAKKEFMYHMSHELKTPISAIIGLNKIAIDSLDDTDKVIHCLTKIDIMSRKVLEIINNVLDVTKMDSKSFILNNENFCLSSSMAILSSMMKEQAELKSQSFIYDIHDIQDDYLVGDSLRLSQILSNCISNSIKFSEPGSKIHLEISEEKRTEDQGFFRFIISDRGKGISEEFLKRIFIPFEQEDNSRITFSDGWGLGLSITDKLVKLMGGVIHIESKVNFGTVITIEISFPFADKNKKDVIYKKIENQNRKIQDKKRVLLVEDNEINREVNAEILRNANLQVDTAADGYEAIELFEDSKQGYYHIILMDLCMPKIDGYHTSILIRNSFHPDAKNICIASLSADRNESKEIEMNSVFNYHFTKPIDTNKLSSLIQ